jgi:hypothetical protein
MPELEKRFGQVSAARVIRTTISSATSNSVTGSTTHVSCYDARFISGSQLLEDGSFRKQRLPPSSAA